jgi:hypothetical protein
MNTSTPKRTNSVIVIYSPGDMKPREIPLIAKENREGWGLLPSLSPVVFFNY